VLELFLQITDAVSFCHQNLVAHRDIKSENIVVTDESIPKLVDFGLAVPLSNPPQLCEDKCGTIPFAPPEVYRGKPFEATAMDVWSLGILTFEMRCGNNSVCQMLGCAEKAEPNERLAEVMEQFFANPDWPASVKRYFPGVGMAQELIVVLRGCLVVGPESRWAASDLWQHIANSPSGDRITSRLTTESTERHTIHSCAGQEEEGVERTLLELDSEWNPANGKWPNDKERETAGANIRNLRRPRYSAAD
jgi:serine/threonine protein kinase